MTIQDYSPYIIVPKYLFDISTYNSHILQFRTTHLTRPFPHPRHHHVPLPEALAPVTWGSHTFVVMMILKSRFLMFILIMSCNWSNLVFSRLDFGFGLDLDLFLLRIEIEWEWTWVVGLWGLNGVSTWNTTSASPQTRARLKLMPNVTFSSPFSAHMLVFSTEMQAISWV